MSDTVNYRPLNPAKFTESFGIARILVKQDKLEWNARIGVSFRFNIQGDLTLIVIILDN